jgi:preprotein translocase subunit SecA
MFDLKGFNVPVDSLKRLMQFSPFQSEPQFSPRPGVYLGCYPSRQQEKLSTLDTWLNRLSGIVTDRIGKLLDDNDDFVRKITGQDTVIRNMNDKVLNALIVDVKKKLHRQGLAPDLIVSAFAVIREVSRRELDMAHFDCQLIGGRVMMRGKIAEMQTGEGKTLTATLPAACAAMAGIPVHVITANEYLVRRDLELMTPVYQRLGLTSGCIVNELDDARRRETYACDIVYCTGQQLVFDYLKDRLVLKQYATGNELRLASLVSGENPRQHLLMRGLNFAIIDEADSVLIDEARTPLILSRQSDNRLQESMNREAVWLARQLRMGKHFSCDTTSRSVALTSDGEAVLEDLTADMDVIWQGRRRRGVLVSQALSALHNFRRDIDYIVVDGKIVIIDENTGRMMPDRSWEAGLHQMIEEKEGCEQSGMNETIARISYQRFFVRYCRLAGMTGTAKEVRGELLNVYGLHTETVPTNKPSRRIDRGARIYASHPAKWDAVVASVVKERNFGRPVLIGTRTLEDSEIISRLLIQRNIPHQLLNAKQDAEEAAIVARAGEVGRVTVATNMAGRGTDIPLTEAASEAGGLHVIGCEKNASSRIDRQLYGRCARQGDAGSHEAILSMQDEIAVRYFSAIVKHLPVRVSDDGICLLQMLPRILLFLAQKISETGSRRLRKAMMQADERRDSMMAFSGKSE